MPIFHARRIEAGIMYWNLECISHANHDERAGSLTVTLIDGRSFKLEGEEADDVLDYIHCYRHVTAARDVTPRKSRPFGSR